MIDRLLLHSIHSFFSNNYTRETDITAHLVYYQEHAFWPMDERERTDVLKVRTVTRALVRISPSFLKRIARGPLSTHQVPAQFVQPILRYKKGVRTCARAAVSQL